MAAVADATVAGGAPVSPQVVGNAFVQQYYQILHRSPELVHRFYQDISQLGRPEEDGTLSVTTTMDEINAKILSLNYDDLRAEIRSVDAQESLNRGVSVLVTGYLTGKDNIVKNFTQSFFLSPQEKGFFVLNDMFRYIENANHNEVVEHAPIEDVIASATPEPAPKIVSVQENNISEQEAVVTEESQAEKIVHVDNGEAVNIEEEIPVPEVVDAVPDSSQSAVESKAKIEELPKKSYASIVIAMKQNGMPFSSPAPAQRKPQPRKQEQHVNKAQTTTIAAEPVASRMDAVENGIPEEEGYSVYIKGLPMSATPAVVEEEFKKFGTIKPNGIQVRSNRGFCFGFVEFEVPDAAQKAIEASPILISGRNTVVEEKRSTISRGGNRGRFIGGRGPGFTRNDGMRGRGNFGSDDGIRGGRRNYTGGRGYNRGDFGGNRNDYGFRSGSRGGGSPSNHGSDGYQRDYNGGGRVNRGVDINGTARNTA